MSEHVGSFAENKDVARDIRLNHIIPALDRNEEVIIDFEGIDATTQSFIHALISDLIRKYGNDVLDRIYFRNCNESVKKIVGIVADYMQEAE
ncbi:MAG: STAS-like domain-containing protein [bacterium]